MLEVRNLSKQFDGNYVLKNINLKIKDGEVYGVIGANGSGKSTFMNILNGKALIAETGGYEGDILIDGTSVSIKNHSQSTDHGIAMVHQELALFSGLSVTRNIKINRENIKGKGTFLPEFSYVDYKKDKAEAEKVLEMIGAQIALDRMIDGLTLNQKQFVELARELDNESIRLLILDEPTSSLNITETKRLLECIREIAARGIAVIFISHRLEEVMEICDVVAVLRDGELVSTYEKSEFSVSRFADDMVGREIVKAERKKKALSREVLLSYDRMNGTDRRLNIYEGEIVGITGLAGQGQEQFSEGLFGLKAGDYQVRFCGEELKKGDNPELIKQGIYYLSEDRSGTSLFLESPIWKNIIFGTEHKHPEFMSMPKLLPLSFLQKKVIKEYSEKMIEELNILCSGPEQKLRELSGGNQQKVCISRAITFGPKLLFVGEPTRGIDIYSKELILNWLLEMNQKNGTTIVITSGEIEELIRICDRVIVMYQGQVFKIFEGNIEPEEIMLSLYGRTADEK